MKGALIIGMYILGNILFSQNVLAQQVKPISRTALDSLVYPPLMAGADKVLKFSTPVQHIGTVEETHPEITLHYPFRNVSTDTLHITHIRTLCGCTQSDGFTRVLPPEAEDSITIRFLPLGKVGRIRQRVYVYTNINTKPVACLEIVGQVTEK